MYNKFIVDTAESKRVGCDPLDNKAAIFITTSMEYITAEILELSGNIQRDRITKAKDRIPWDWIKLADAEGFRTMGVPKKFGGSEESILTMCIVGEELGVGDLGFAVIMDQCWKMAHLFKDAMSEHQQNKYIPEFVKDPIATTAIGISEPGIGSDHQGYYDHQDIDMITKAHKFKRV